MFSQFPKIRPELQKEIAAVYSAYYKSNREGRTPASSLSQRMESWLHRQVAKDMVDQDKTKTTLEIGAGTLNQLKYEPVAGPYDIVEPFGELYKDSDSLKRIRNIYSDVNEIPDSYKYDRITSVATFEHICNLPEVIASCGLLLSTNGLLRVSIPSEGTLLWTLGWKLTTGLEFRIKHGLDYGLLMKHEHVNKAREIEELLEYFFKNIERRYYGISRSFSLYQFYSCSDPRVEKCREFIC